MTVQYKGVTIPSTGRDWELYTSSMACSQAARNLTSALKRSFRLFDKYCKDRNVVDARNDAFYAEGGIWDTLSKHSEYGAFDSEPCYHAEKAMTDYFRLRVYGPEGVDRGF